jgi:cobalt-zinc-cadmium efflux system membrane fusion protein
MRPTLWALLILFAVAVAPSIVSAHEGHDHGPPSVEAPTAAAPRAEAQSDLFELVAIVRDGALTVFLDRFVGNHPVSGAAIELETPEGAKSLTPVDDRYRLDAPWMSAPGAHDLLFTVVVGADVDVLTTTLVVPQSTGEAGLTVRGPLERMALAFGGSALPHAGLGLAAFAFACGLGVAGLLRTRRRMAVVAAGALVFGALFATGAFGQSAPTVRDVARRLPDGSVFMPKQTQRLLEVRTLLTEQSAHQVSVELPGRVIADPNASGYVQAAVSGRLSAPSSGFPRLGARVTKGQVLAYVSAPLSAAEALDLRQRQGELDQQISIVQQRIDRFEKLIGSGAVSRVQLEEARLELDGLRDRRQALERMRREPEPLVAPVDGFVAAANAVAGQIADANAIIFQVVDPQRLWVEAQSLEAIPDVVAAEARAPDGRRFPLAFKGAGLADRSQFLPIHFSLPEGEAGVRIGQFVSVFVQTAARVEGVAAPRAAVLTGANGQSVVYEHARAERFEPREVRVAPLDASRVLISAGVGQGRRIVVQGAELLNQVR